MFLSSLLKSALDAENDVAIVLDPSCVIRFVNPAWSSAAEESEGPSAEVVLNRPYLDFMGGPLRAKVSEALDAALRGLSGQGLSLHSECNTKRFFRPLTTHFATLRGANKEIEGVVIRQSVRVVGPLAQRYTLSEAAPEAYFDDRGFIVQCSCCRRVREPTSKAWRMSLPMLSYHSKLISHGLCESCLEIYFPELPAAIGP